MFCAQSIRLKLVICGILLAAQCGVVLQTAFARDFIRCESIDGRQRYCRARTHGRVRIDRRLSDAGCELGRTWGYDRGGVWVRGGCRAIFEVDSYRPYYPDDYDSYDRSDSRDSGFSNGETAAIALGALVGGAVLGSLANQNTGAQQQPPPRPPSAQVGSVNPSQYPPSSGGAYESEYERGRVPSWLVGQFQGQSTQFRKPLSLTVYSDATAFISSGTNKDEGQYRNGEISISNRRYTVSQEGSGVTLREVGNSRNEIRMSRVY